MSTGPKRYHEFDALRGFAMLLGIVLHGALSFALLPIWPAQDLRQNPESYGFLQHAIHGFRMPVFFLMSGFFTAMLWRRRGAKGLVVHRARRILIPLVVGTIVLWPIMIGVSAWGTSVRAGRERARSGRPDIWMLAKAGDMEGLQRMIEGGVDVNGRDSLGVSPLEWASIYGHPDVVTRLVENGAGVDARNRQGSTALHAAACFGRTDAARRLIELGADVVVRNDRGDTPLQAARVDMVIVHYIAGFLQVPIDGEEVALRRRETAAYLEGVEAGHTVASVGSENVAWSGEADDLGAGKVRMSRSAGGEGGHDRLWEQLRGFYLGATFFPLFHHLWFLYYLLWLVALFLVAVWVGRRFSIRVPDGMIAMPWCLGWLIPLTLVPQLFMTQTFGVDTAPGILPWLPSLAYYAIFFGFGAIGFGRSEFEEKAGHYWILWLGMAVPTLFMGLYFFREGEGRLLARGLTASCAVLYAWAMVFGLVGCFQRFFAGERKWVRYVSDASYWLYLAHLPLIIGLQVWVSNWDVHHFPKFLFVCALTFVVLLVAYEYGIRYTWVGTMLNGKRVRSTVKAEG